MKEIDPSFTEILRKYFNVNADKEDEQTIIQNIESSISFRGAQLWILIFAVFIASLGLNVNSTAVIIGAMLISPLMSPIIGMGLAVGISDLGLLKRSFVNYLVATVISVLTAALYFSITPLNEAQSELLARTTPTLYDVLIALLGGAAGFVALSTRGKGNVIPGVAIATALMPPLCTAGYGLAVGNLSYFLGAFYLFFINSVFICLSTLIGTRMLKFKSIAIIGEQKILKVRRYIIVVVLLTMLPAAYMTVQIIRESITKNNLRHFVKTELSFKGTQILSQNINEKDKVVSIVALGKIIPHKVILQAKGKLSRYQLDGYKLNIIQGEQSDSLLMINQELMNATISNESNSQKIIEQLQQLHHLEGELDRYVSYESTAREISQEMKYLFPDVSKISLANTSEFDTDSVSQQRYVVALVSSRSKFKDRDKEKLQLWLKKRTQADSLRLVLIP